MSFMCRIAVYSRIDTSSACKTMQKEGKPGVIQRCALISAAPHAHAARQSGSEARHSSEAGESAECREDVILLLDMRESARRPHWVLDP